MLADFGAAFTPVADPATGELAGLVRYRGHLLDALDRERMQLVHPKPRSLATIIKARIRALEGQVQRLEKLIAGLVESTPHLKRGVGIMTAVKGVGLITAVSLLAAMPELGTHGRNQAAARKALYMAALVASRYNEALKATYANLVGRGKAKKTALVAVMCKLVFLLNTLMKKQSNGDPDPAPATC